jgi:hypothetical protein
MSDSNARTMPLPKEGFLGVQALVQLGEVALRNLAEAIVDVPLDLSFSNLNTRLAASIQCDPQTLQTACLQALIPFNGLRRTLEMSVPEFVESLVSTVRERAPSDWQRENWDQWERVARVLPPLLQPDSPFSVASKAFDLLSERPAILQNLRILTVLRPIFDETITRTLTILQTNTLVLNYWDGNSMRTLHVTVDSDDLRNLQEELDRAKRKIDVSRREATQQGAQLLVYGQSASQR